jgi:hypothetical protein
MRLRLSRHLRHLTVPIALLGTAGVLVGIIGVPLGATTACGCELPTVTLHEGSTSGAAIPVGTTLVGTSGSITIHMSAGNVECTKSKLSGELQSNKSTSDKIDFTEAAFSECTTTFSGKPTATVTAETPGVVEVQWWAIFTRAWLEPFIPKNHLAVTLSSGPKCVYDGSLMAEGPSAGPPFFAKVSNKEMTEESGESPCEAKAELSGEYVFKTSGGKEIAVTTP